MWQAVHEELAPRGFTVVAVALDSGGAATTAPWIRAAKATYPSLIDERHIVADLYGMVNVPNAVWIDETGVIVRPAETAGSTDAFRWHFDRPTRQMRPEGLAERERARRAYFDAVRDWVAHGARSRFALDADEIRRRLTAGGAAAARAGAAFRLAQYLARQGHLDAARPYLAEARALHPESWSYRRQAWELEATGTASGPEFWAAVDALGDRPYYPAPLA